MFIVRWEDEALSELASLWTEANSSQRQAITVATNEIDIQLESRPFALGESRPGGRRIHFVYPLGLLFRIEQDEQTVSVLHLWQFQIRSP